MPRKAYPSDHRRYFRVMEDILDDPKLAECPLRACWLFIQILASLNRMKSRDGRVDIPLRSIHAFARGRDWSVTRPALESLQEQGLIEFERHGMSLALFVPNWAKHQGFTPAELRRDSVQTPSPTPTPTPNPVPRKRKSAPAGALCLCPETLGDDDLKKLYAWSLQNGFSPYKDKADAAFERVRDWSHTSRKKRTRWWVVTKNAMQDGWALKGGGNGKPSKSWAQQQEDETLEWLRGVSDGTDRKSLGTGAGTAVPDVSERSNGGDQDDIPF